MRNHSENAQVRTCRHASKERILPMLLHVLLFVSGGFALVYEVLWLRQFELHQTVNDNDVENAVWHYLCVARLAGVEKAHASLIRIQRDSRVPMMAVYALFGGKA